MATFQYEAVAPSGRIVKGAAESSDRAALERHVQQTGLQLLDARVSEDQPTARRNPRSIVRLTRSLSGLLESGLPLTRALSSIAKTAQPDEAEMLSDIRKRLEKGETFSQAIHAHSIYFPPLFQGVVKAGERSGTLADALSRLATHAEAELAIRQKLISAAVYPILLLVSGGSAVIMLLFWILPRFSALLSDAGAALPWSTSVLLAIADILQRALPYLGPATLLAVAAFAWAATAKEGRLFVSRLSFSAPWIERRKRQSVGARFARLMSVLLQGGAPMLEALQITAGSFTDPLVNARILQIRARVREGKSLGAAMQQSELFPELLLDLARFGEQSARLPMFMLRGAEALDSDGQETMRRVTVLAEPALIIFFGLIVGFVALSLLQAVYGLNAGALQ